MKRAKSGFDLRLDAIAEKREWDELEAYVQRLLAGEPVAEPLEPRWYDRPCPILEAGARRTPEQRDAAKAAWDEHARKMRKWHSWRR